VWGKRFGVEWGPNAPRRRTSAAYWKQPLRWNRKSQIAHDAWDKFKTTQGFVKPRCPRVFCGSLCDVFDNAAPEQWRQDLFNLILSTPHLDWLLLTKRIGNTRKMIEDILPANMKALPSGHPLEWPWANVWIGSTICNQEEADRDIPKLLAVPAAKRFLSIEPMLSEIDLSKWLACACNEYWPGQGHPKDCPVGKIDWIIVGGETGPHARPMHPDWVRGLRDQCQAAGTAFFMKQWGEWADMKTAGIAESGPVMTRTGRVKDWLRQAVTFAGGTKCTVQAHSWTGHGTNLMYRVGAKAAGRMLDGREWSEFPA